MQASSSSSTSFDTKMENTADAMFGKFLIPADSIFYRSTKSIAFVNLRPIVPGHVLVIPERTVPLMKDLSQEEYIDLWLAVKSVQAGLRVQYTNCTAFNVAIQDGKAAGQSVPHVHVHILPRYAGDLERNDDIYDNLQQWAPRDELKIVASTLDVPLDTERRDRTRQEMADEAALYRKVFRAMS